MEWSLIHSYFPSDVLMKGCVVLTVSFRTAKELPPRATNQSPLSNLARGARPSGQVTYHVGLGRPLGECSFVFFIDRVPQNRARSPTKTPDMSPPSRTNDVFRNSLISLHMRLASCWSSCFFAPPWLWTDTTSTSLPSGRAVTAKSAMRPPKRRSPWSCPFVLCLYKWS
jgi:hypothetical protein